MTPVGAAVDDTKLLAIGLPVGAALALPPPEAEATPLVGVDSAESRGVALSEDPAEGEDVTRMLPLSEGALDPLTDSDALAVLPPLADSRSERVASEADAGADGVAEALAEPLCEPPAELLERRGVSVAEGALLAVSAPLLDMAAKALADAFADALEMGAAVPLTSADASALRDAATLCKGGALTEGLSEAARVGTGGADAVPSLKLPDGLAAPVGDVAAETVSLPVAHALSGRVMEGVCVGVRVGVDVADAVREAVPVGVGEPVLQALSVGDPDGESLPLSLAVALPVPVKVAVPVFVGVALGVNEALGVGGGEGYAEKALGETLPLSPALREAVGEAVGVGECERLDEKLLEAVGLADPVGVPLVDAVGDSEEVGEGDAEGDRDCEGSPVALGVREGVGDGVEEGEGVAVGVPVMGTLALTEGDA